MLGSGEVAVTAMFDGRCRSLGVIIRARRLDGRLDCWSVSDFSVCGVISIGLKMSWTRGLGRSFVRGLSGSAFEVATVLLESWVVFESAGEGRTAPLRE